FYTQFLFLKGQEDKNYYFMRKWLLVLLAFVGVITTQAQDNASSMKIIVNSDGSISPPYTPFFLSLENEIEALAHTSVQIFDINMNPWGSRAPIAIIYAHIGKFRFIASSDIGIDSGLVLTTGRLSSDSFFFGDEYMGIAWPVT